MSSPARAAPRVVLDHLVVAADSLAAGVRWCEAVFGITPAPGGKHALMGSHNRLVRIDGAGFESAYLEIIAIDPEAPPPGRARWFGLDAPERGGPPRLLHWVARSSDLDATRAALIAEGFDPGPPIAASRATPQGRLEWRITVRDDGAVLAGGALPTLIQWTSAHPGATLPASGVVLRSLTLRGLAPRVLRALALDGVAAADDPGAAIGARFDTPRGMVTLESGRPGAREAT